MKKHHHNKKIRILILALLIIGSWTAYQGYQYFNPKTTEESTHYMFLTIDTTRNLTDSEVKGYSTEEYEYKTVTIMPINSINFYTLSPGLQYASEMTITNRNNQVAKIDYQITGDIARFITVEAPETIAPKETINIDIIATIPETDVTSGKYRGNFTIRLTPNE